ncbi:hypothetical protein JCM30471_32430 [Desulfuromonas carbonis]|uniref:hypothetical protein n=1 Tax=Desulfuromonas sp. DDH964 TaxID=1823759 RepID=UPI00078D743F|nr:hypothetical protein [Desulfuromonas sp. DDH964]AMV71404.1 hypothetical protein DBW_1022 [Desulfuromonas sp. DDH964]
MTGKTPAPGDTVEARCTRCRTLTNHTIVALVETRIARVQCNTCGGTHNFHPPAEPAKSRTKAVRTKAEPRVSAKGKGDQLAWQQACSEADPASAAPYAMDRSYKVGTLVNHPLFGVGIVTLLTPPNKVEILFQAGRKLLRCA